MSERFRNVVTEIAYSNFRVRTSTRNCHCMTLIMSLFYQFFILHIFF